VALVSGLLEAVLGTKSVVGPLLRMDLLDELDDEDAFDDVNPTLDVGLV
jgi:hypothetical protein